MKQEINVITWGPDRKLILTKLPVVDGQVEWNRDTYKLDYSKILTIETTGILGLQRKQEPIVILNPFLIPMEHTLTENQWMSKIERAMKK